MATTVTTRTVEPLRLAAVRDRANQRDLPAKIGRHVGTVLTALRAAQTPFGRCVVIYWEDGGPECLIKTEAGVPIAVGWEVEGPVPGADTTVVAEATPAGVAATVTHVGPYPEVGRAHDAIHAWARQQGHRLAGPNWEVYDHPQDGQPPRVDVFYLLG